MIRVHSSEQFPRELRQQLEHAERSLFTRSVVLLRGQSSEFWTILGCVLRPVRKGAEAPAAVTYEYKDAVLSLDVLGSAQCISFIEGLALSDVAIAGRSVQFQSYFQTEIVRVGVRNSWMEQAGTVYTFSPKTNNPMPHERLLRTGAPYYPDPHEANKDWLGLRAHHGSSDGNNGKVVFLLPETRGFIDDFHWEADKLELRVAGTATESENLQVIGAFWSAAGIQQLASPVTAGHATLHIPSDAKRLELFVLGDSGQVYEHHQEQVGFGPEHGRFLGARSQLSEIVSQVKLAIAKGERVDVEFKAWVDVQGQLKENSKLKQVLQTVAAYANTSGGTVYIGVNDNSEVVGINVELAKSTKTATDESSAKSYLGELRTRVTDSLHGPVAVTTALANVEGKLVAMLHVERSLTPVSISNECLLYVRKGATNAKVPPAEWLAKAEKASWDS
jgi:Putative DNA-binding domain